MNANWLDVRAKYKSNYQENKQCGQCLQNGYCENKGIPLRFERYAFCYL